MKLAELITRLSEIEAQGLGDRRVLDDNGNDVMAVDGPVGADDCDDPDVRAVMLRCYIDSRRR